MKSLVLGFLFSILILGSLVAEDLTLPTYYIQMDPADLQTLIENPQDDTYFDAVFTFQDTVYNCGIRFRGATSLDLYPQKPSWKIKFEDNNNIFEAEKLDLNAEYSDRSLMRNYLTMKLYQHRGYISSDVSFVNLYVNNEYQGLLVQNQNVDEDYLAHNNLQPNDLYKAKNHGANTAPLTHHFFWTKSWEKKIGDKGNYRDIKQIINKIFYLSDEDFANEIENLVDVDNVLNYFATEFTIVSKDCVSKNFYFYHNPETDKFQFFPWDNDGTYGNNAPNGNYHSENIEMNEDDLLDKKTLILRLLNIPEYKNIFTQKVNSIINSDFNYLSNLIDSTYSLIANDWYQQPEDRKCCSNSEFDAEVGVLQNFLLARKNYLQNHIYSFEIGMSDNFCDNSFPTNENPECEIMIKSNSEQNVLIVYAYNIQFDEWGGDFDFSTQALYDNGQHDADANDLIYGTSLDTSELPEGLILYTFAGWTSDQPRPTNEELKAKLSSEIGKYFQQPNDRDYFWNGLFYLNYYRTNMLALNKLSSQIDYSQALEIEDVFQTDSESTINIRNISDQPIDLSYCYLQNNEYYQNFIIPENTVIQPDSLLIITNQKQTNQFYYPNAKVIEKYFYDFEVGNNLKILDPSLGTILTYTINSISQHTPIESDVIINEINYKSSDDFDTGDWIELYNKGDQSADISGWIIRDSDDSHAFVIPDGTVLSLDSYLVIAKKIDDFQSLFPDVQNVLGGLGFGLSGSGDSVRLFNQDNILADIVDYSDEDPWTSEADGTGKTLELIYPFIDNSLPQSWSASLEVGGTPGQQNSVYEVGNEDDVVMPHNDFIAYPNPYFKSDNSNLNFKFQIADKSTKGSLNIYNIRGQKVKSVTLTNLDTKSKYVWNGKNNFGQNVSSGIYFVELKLESHQSVVKKIMVIK